MQITLNLDEALLHEALKLTEITTQEELMNLALQEFISSRSGSKEVLPERRNLLDLAGQIEFAPDFDHKALRELRYAAD